MKFVKLIEQQPWTLHQLVNYNAIQQLQLNPEETQFAKNIWAHRLAYEIEYNKATLVDIFQIKQRDNELIKQALQIAKLYQFDNQNLVKEIRIVDYRYKQLADQYARKWMIKSLGIGILMMGLSSILIQSYFYLEYDMWLTSPSVSDYHLQRFK